MRHEKGVTAVPQKEVGGTAGSRVIIAEPLVQLLNSQEQAGATLAGWLLVWPSPSVMARRILGIYAYLLLADGLVASLLRGLALLFIGSIGGWISVFILLERAGSVLNTRNSIQSVLKLF